MTDVAELYLAVRAKEQRIYTDEVVARLPDVPAEHPHRVEWSVRRASANRLVAYFGGRPEPLRILDLGCGNGWLSAALARLPGARVYGVDTNLLELTQAARVFKAQDQAAFLAADVFQPPFREGGFDAIVLASSVQYFDDVRALLLALRPLLSPDGEVHIIDSHFYEENEVEDARNRSEAYYRGLGYSEMAACYHHHRWSELDGYTVGILHDPSAPKAKLFRKLGKADSPFPWLRLTF